MYPRNSQFSNRADGMPEAMPPSAFERSTPKPPNKPLTPSTPKMTPITKLPKPKYGGGGGGNIGDLTTGTNKQVGGGGADSKFG